MKDENFLYTRRAKTNLDLCKTPLEGSKE